MLLFLLIILLVATILTFSLLPDEHDKWSVLENKSKTKIQEKERFDKDE